MTRARQSIKNHEGPLPGVPLHLRNASTKLMKDLGMFIYVGCAIIRVEKQPIKTPLKPDPCHFILSQYEEIKKKCLSIDTLLWPTGCCPDIFFAHLQYNPGHLSCLFIALHVGVDH